MKEENGTSAQSSFLLLTSCWAKGSPSDNSLKKKKRMSWYRSGFLVDGIDPTVFILSLFFPLKERKWPSVPSTKRSNVRSSDFFVFLARNSNPRRKSKKSCEDRTGSLPWKKEIWRPHRRKKSLWKKRSDRFSFFLIMRSSSNIFIYFSFYWSSIFFCSLTINKKNKR